MRVIRKAGHGITRLDGRPGSDFAFLDSQNLACDKPRTIFEQIVRRLQPGAAGDRERNFFKANCVESAAEGFA
jgi:hypothetical protein